MYLTFENIMFTLLTVGLLFLFNRVVLVPRRIAREARAEAEEMRGILEEKCPPRLVSALSKHRGENGEVQISDETRSVLNKCFSGDAVYEAIRAVEKGKIDIMVVGNRREDARWLSVAFDGEEITEAYFSLVGGIGGGGFAE
mgnify:FL=1